MKMCILPDFNDWVRYYETGRPIYFKCGCLHIHVPPSLSLCNCVVPSEIPSEPSYGFLSVWILNYYFFLRMPLVYCANSFPKSTTFYVHAFLAHLKSL